MRVNDILKTMDMEVADISYFLQAYLLSYLYVSQNEDPIKVIIPKFSGFTHPRKPGVMIPIEWVEPDSPIAAEIIKDRSGPTKDDAQQLEDGAADLQLEIDTEPKPKLSPAEVAPKASIVRLLQQAARVPKMPPGGDIGLGHADNLSSRNLAADRQIARDILPDASVDESKEIEADIAKPV